MLHIMEYRYYCGTARPDGGPYIGMSPTMFAHYLRSFLHNTYTGV